MSQPGLLRRVLVVGSGGREHALAWKIAQAPCVAQVYVAPGNGGTERGAPKVCNASVGVDDVEGLVAFAREHEIDLTVVGPESSLAAGLVDRFLAAGLCAFGPTRAAAQIETSKAFAKEFMRGAGIPTAAFQVFSDYQTALGYVRSLGGSLVVKASGLAAGKGAVICDTMAQAEQALADMLQDRVFGDAGSQVVVEERLTGPEVSLMAFTDGRTVAPMPAAQDHKRVFDGDRGPNTGGMGAYSPVPIFPPAMLDEAMETVVKPTVRGLAARGLPYVGVLYAGLMLTPAGMKVLEFNCRFGDPETQAILPLLESDLVEVIDACLDGRLDQVSMRWRDGAAATVVAAAPGYPGSYPKGLPISGVDEAAAGAGVTVFHAGTQRRSGQLVTSGGRVLAVTAVGVGLSEALDRAYAALKHIHFEGMHYRKDIGAASKGAP